MGSSRPAQAALKVGPVSGLRSSNDLLGGKTPEGFSSTPNRTWLYKSVAHMRSGGVAHEWKWTAQAPDGATVESRLMFSTLNQCVEDAQRHGFRGKVDATSGSVAGNAYTIELQATEHSC